MSMKEQLALDQVLYHKPISVTRQFLDFVMNMRVQAPVRITPAYIGGGWSAEVAAEDKVWTITCDHEGEVRLIKVADLRGHTYNGHYLKAAEENIEEYERHFMKENYYGGLEILPVTCDLFCNSEEAQCRFCPYGRR